MKSTQTFFLNSSQEERSRFSRQSCAIKFQQISFVLFCISVLLMFGCLKDTFPTELI